jgi:cytochrome c-type biogenesis protein CcmH/NrfG
LDAAEADAKLALSIAQSAQGHIPYSDRTGLSWLMLGRVMAKQGDTAEAGRAFHAAVDNLANTIDEDHPALLLAREFVQSSSGK